MKQFKVQVGVCTHRDVKVRMHSILWALRECPNIDISPIIQDGDALISRSRNKVATYFVKGDADYLLFLDDDIVIGTVDATKMMWEAYANKYPILGAAYSTKSQESPTMAIMTKEKKGQFKFGASGGIIPVECVSTGCMLISRRVFETFIKKEAAHYCKQGYYTFFQHREEKIDGEWDDLSEDWWFCRKASQLGIQTFLDTRPKLSHIGQFEYNWDYMLLNGSKKVADDIVLNYDLLKK